MALRLGPSRKHLFFFSSLDKKTSKTRLLIFENQGVYVCKCDVLSLVEVIVFSTNITCYIEPVEMQYLAFS